MVGRWIPGLEMPVQEQALCAGLGLEMLVQEQGRSSKRRDPPIGGKRLLVEQDKTLAGGESGYAHRQSSDSEGDEGGLALLCLVPAGSLPDPMRNLRDSWVSHDASHDAVWAASFFKIVKNQCLP